MLFFPQKLNVNHSLGRAAAPLNKKVFLNFCIVFFYPNKNVYFFSWNNLLSTHSLVLEGRKKIQPRKKKCQKINFYEKKPRIFGGPIVYVVVAKFSFQLTGIPQ